MDWFAKAFIRASLAWLAVGVTLGVAMAVDPALIVYRPVHVHVNLLGFVTMMIYGVAYHAIPRFVGRTVHSRAIAGWQWWLANVGLAVLAAGFVLRGREVAWAIPVLGAGGTLAAVAAWLFAYNIWRTLDAPAPAPAPPPATTRAPLPLAEPRGRR